MRKYDDSLFQIGEVSKILGVTRKTLLVYEDMGLLTPAVKDEDSGFRYYTADNMTQILCIRSLQSLGLTLKEVAEYYYDTENMDKHLERFLELRATLDRNIQMLQVRSTKQGDLTVHKITLPRQVCFCRQYRCKDIAEAAVNLRDTYIAAARTGKMSMIARMFTMRMNQDPNVMELMCCIPVDDSFNALYIGLPCTVGAVMGMGYFNTKSNALAADFTLCHETVPPLHGFICKPPFGDLRYNNVCYVMYGITTCRSLRKRKMKRTATRQSWLIIRQG